jgi:hypothetical protein
MIDDGAGMHEYSYVLFLGFVVVPASDPKDLFVEHVTMWTTQIIGLALVGVVK